MLRFGARQLPYMAAAILFATSGLARAGEPGLVVHMSEPFAIRGIHYPPSTITVRQVHDYTPSTSLDEIWVGNECIGMVMGRIGDPEAPVMAGNVALFHRGENGSLELYGYSLASSGSGTRSVRLTPAPHAASFRSTFLTQTSF